MYKPKVILARLHTGGKSLEEIQRDCEGQGLTPQDIINIQKANEQFDGVQLYLSLWDYDNYGAYHLYGWQDDVDEKMMMGIYFMEQVHPFPQYKDNLEGFIKDWKAKEYEPSCALCFEKAQVEELGIVQEESQTQETETAEIEEMRRKLAAAPDTCPFTGMRKCDMYMIDGNIVYLPTPAYDAYTLPEYDRETLSFNRIRYDMDDDNREEFEHLCDLAEALNLKNFEEIKEMYGITTEEIIRAIKECKETDNNQGTNV